MLGFRSPAFAAQDNDFEIERVACFAGAATVGLLLGLFDHLTFIPLPGMSESGIGLRTLVGGP